jgi:nicotinamidase-related amidase
MSMTSLPKTLRELAGATAAPVRLAEAVLLVIDAQEEYRSGALPLPQIGPTAEVVAGLLAAAREAGAPIVHVAHRGKAGGPFDLNLPRGAFLAEAMPEPGETVVEKTLPDAFAGTGLAEALAATARNKLVIAGYMTHNCIAATAHSALSRGYDVTIVADASATRALPLPGGGTIEADALHRATLAGLADRVAAIALAREIVAAGQGTASSAEG